MYAVYRSGHRIPELGAEPGDLIVVDTADPDAPLSVVREFGRVRLPLILGHIDRLTLLELSPGASPSRLREHLLRAVGCDVHVSRPEIRLLR